MPAETAKPAVQTLTIAWIQSAQTLRTYLGALPLPIRIGDPASPAHLENIDTDLRQAYEALTTAPIPPGLALALRQATAAALLSLSQIGRISWGDAQLWEYEAAHLTLAQVATKLNQAGSWN